MENQNPNNQLQIELKEEVASRHLCQFGYHYSFQFRVYSRLCTRDARDTESWSSIACCFGTRTCQTTASCIGRKYW